jgi:hypothetical protein
MVVNLVSRVANPWRNSEPKWGRLSSLRTCFSGSIRPEVGRGRECSRHKRRRADGNAVDAFKRSAGPLSPMNAFALIHVY